MEIDRAGRPLRVLLAGGGSGGSSTPLLAVAQALRHLRPDVEMLYVGTATGPERSLAEQEGLSFAAVSAGRLRRYVSLSNLIDPWRVVAGIGQSLRLVRHFRPTIGLGAGGFASVPPLVACRLAGVPIAVHQQDVLPGLANRLVAPLASLVSVSFAESSRHFPRHKVRLTGNPVRPSLAAADRERARRHFCLEPAIPTVLVTGGGTGALGLNRLVAVAAPELTRFCQVIHLTGRGRVPTEARPSPRYRLFEFLTDEMPLALVAADLVVSRAGMGTISELAFLAKPALLIPMPKSHQLANARAVAAVGGAVVCEQERLTPGELARLIQQLLTEPERLAQMGRALSELLPHDAADRLARLLLSLAAGVVPRR